MFNVSPRKDACQSWADFPAALQLPFNPSQHDSEGRPDDLGLTQTRRPLDLLYYLDVRGPQSNCRGFDAVLRQLSILPAQHFAHNIAAYTVVLPDLHRTYACPDSVTPLTTINYRAAGGLSFLPCAISPESDSRNRFHPSLFGVGRVRGNRSLAERRYTDQLDNGSICCQGVFRATHRCDLSSSGLPSRASLGADYRHSQDEVGQPIRRCNGQPSPKEAANKSTNSCSLPGTRPRALEQGKRAGFLQDSGNSLATEAGLGRKRGNRGTRISRLGNSLTTEYRPVLSRRAA